MDTSSSNRYQLIASVVFCSIFLHACSSSDNPTPIDPDFSAFPATPTPVESTPLDSAPVATTPTINVSEANVLESDEINTSNESNEAADISQDNQLSGNNDPLNDSASDGNVDANVDANDIPATDTMVTLETQANGSMLFLARLGDAPYGNLPLVSYDLSYQDIRFGNVPDTLDGCLLARFGLFYCYEPDNRILRSTLADGEPFWSFTLPGDNGTNRIDGIAMTDGRELALVANITTEFGNPKHEASFFNSQGAFDRTMNILTLHDTIWPSVNLQGEPLEVLQSNTNSNDPFPLLVVGNTYELDPGGNRAIPDDWEQTGIMRTTIDPLTGKYLKVELCEGARVAVDEGGVGMELCDDTPDDSPLAVRNTGQSELAFSFNRITSLSIRSTAELPTVFLEAFGSLGFVTDLQCDPFNGNINCLNTELPNIDDEMTSSVATLQCPELSWNTEAFQSTLGTAQWSRKIVRTSSDQVEVHDIMTFTERCELTNINGQLTGNVTVVTTLDSNSGEVLDTETRFEDLGSVAGGDFHRFINGTFRDTSDDSTFRYELNAEQVFDGLICNRSCPPNIIIAGHYSDLDLTSSQGKNSNTNYAHRYNAQWTQTLGNPSDNPSIGFAETVSADIVYTAPSSESVTAGTLEGFVELIQTDNSQIRMEPTRNINYPNLPFVEYSAMATTGESFAWSLPIDAFLIGNIVSYSGRQPPVASQ